MLALEKLLHRERIAGLKAEGMEREVGERVFIEMRDRYITNLCGYIRSDRQAKARKLKVPEPYRSADWCNAAVHLMTAADIEIQDFFLRAAPDVKDKLVAAVLVDGGIVRLDGFFSELPPI